MRRSSSRDDSRPTSPCTLLREIARDCGEIARDRGEIAASESGAQHRSMAGSTSSESESDDDDARDLTDVLSSAE